MWRGINDYRDISGFFGGWAFHPAPKLSKKSGLPTLLSEDLHRSGFNLLGNLLRG